jgi:very-short-patch-repair endonuclease
MLPWLEQSLPRRLRELLRLIDGRAEAGTETLARLGLAPLGRHVEIQVSVGKHRLDILIDGWLNIEIDSEEWHGKDRLKFSRRDTWLVGRGFVVLRFDYAEVMFEWEACLAAVRTTLSVGPPRRTV